ncbi:MAG: methylated-DNA--[protein]-cysteine S-methyltransferase [Alkaliphilus sp.]|nr:methylated-DNA--[protein]-cysteine S-methyltransferase [Alkaliphilus sp.]
MSNVYFTNIDTAIGPLYVASSKKGVCRIGLSESYEVFTSWLFKYFENIEENHKKNSTVVEQLFTYFDGSLKNFSVDLDLRGTPFQVKVWTALSKIRYGDVCSYKELAILAGSPKGFRAVGMANNKNPIPVVIPCHRVIGSDHGLVGFGGGLDMKKYLLELEGRSICDGKVVMK